MSKLVPPSDIQLYRVFFEEGMSLGEEVKYSRVKTEVKNTYNDRLYDYDEAITINVGYEDSPKVSYLKSLGWFVEGSEEIPILAYIPTVYQGNDFTVNKGDKLRFVEQSPDREVGEYMINDVKRDSIHGVYHIAKLIPLRDVKTDFTPSDGNSFINME